VPRLTSRGNWPGLLAKLLLAERRRPGTPRGSRALNCLWQAVPGLRWFRGRTAPDALARDHGISRTTACRYLDAVIAVLAGEASDLREALERAGAERVSHVILDGTVIPADPCKESAISVKGEVIDLWYSGKAVVHHSKAHVHGGNIQAVTAPGGFPLWFPALSPDRCARYHGDRSPRLPRYRAAVAGLPTLADPGYDRTGIGVHIPVRQSPGGRTAISMSGPQCAAPLAALPQRTRVRPGHRPLARPSADHRRLLQDRRHRPRGRLRKDQVRPTGRGCGR